MWDKQYCWTEHLADGVTVYIRPLCKDDAKIDREFIEALSSSSRWFRFLNAANSPSPDLIDQLTDIDQLRQVALIATITIDEVVKAIGVARYSIDRDSDCAEFALVVADSEQKKGLGTMLLNHLIEIARANGIRKLYSIDSADNLKASELAKKLDFESTLDASDRTQIIHSKYIVRLELDRREQGAG